MNIRSLSRTPATAAMLALLLILLAASAGALSLASEPALAQEGPTDGTSASACSPQTSGGRDRQFGYTVTDSDDPGGPAYEWVEISKTGTSVALNCNNCFHGPVPIGFPFNFYGNEVTTFYITSNGQISFSAGVASQVNHCPLPDATGMNNFIALMWDNLDPQDTGDLAYYQRFDTCPIGSGACLVVQFQNFCHYAGGPYCDKAGIFEGILFDNNDIRVQFKSADSEWGEGSTTGIENADGSDGLTYACDEIYSLKSGLAVQFTYPRPGPSLANSRKRATAKVELGGPISYTVDIVSTKALTAAATMTDVLPAGVAFVEGSLACQPGDCRYDAADRAVYWSGPSSSSPACQPVTLFFDDLKGGLGHWTSTGLWNAEWEGGGCAAQVSPFPSADGAAYYGRDGICDYDTGARTTGDLSLIFDVDLTGASGATLRFWSYEETECGAEPCKLDKRYVDVSTDGGATWDDPPLWASAGPEGEWYQASADLGAYLGGPLRLRFRFDSIDESDNGHLGWFVDNVEIVGCLPSARVTFAAESLNWCGEVLNQAVAAAPGAEPVTVGASSAAVDRLYYFWDFEADGGGWLPNAGGEWEWGSPAYPVGLAAHSGGKVWGTDLEGTLDAWSVLSRTVSLPADAVAPSLQWWDWYGEGLICGGCDGIEVLVDDTSVYVARDADQRRWQHHTVDLSPWTGQTVVIRFGIYGEPEFPPDGWYLDDVAIHGGCLADAGTGPAPVVGIACKGLATTLDLPICNAGPQPLEWGLKELTAGTLVGAQHAAPREAGAPLQEGRTVDLPAAPASTVNLVLDDGDADRGRAMDAYALLLNRFTPDPRDYPLRLERISLISTGADIGDEVELFVWEDTDGDGDPGTGANLLGSEDVTIAHNDWTTWNEVDLATDIVLNGPGDVLIGYTNRTSNWDMATLDETVCAFRSWYGVYSAGEVPASPVLPPDEEWTYFGGAGFSAPGNLMLRGRAQEILHDVPWLSVDPARGSATTGGCAQAEVTVDASDLPVGTYYAGLALRSNDPDTPLFTVPVSVTVVTPVEMGAVTWLTDGCSVSFEAGASGGGTLAYTWDFGDGQGTSSQEDPAYTYRPPGGCFDVRLAVDNGCSQDAWGQEVCVQCPMPVYLPVVLKNHSE